MQIWNRIILMLIFLSLFSVIECTTAPRSPKIAQVVVKPGIDVLLQKKLNLISGKKVGLITNPTGVTANLKSTIDALYELPEIELVALFGPEHGVRGDIAAGNFVPQYIDEKTGITVYSLYGATKKPTPDMLTNVDILLYDIQDVGCRTYTYIYTMAYAMQAAKEANIPFMVLDRPNPLGGNRVEGNVLDPSFSSFIGLYPIPYVHGMTVGELAKLFNEEFNIHCKLTVIVMENWRRNMIFEETGLSWVPTSPHIPHAESCFFYATTGCIGELGTVSNGVGYTIPFELIGVPWIDGNQFADELNSRKLRGVHFRPLYFKPFYFRFINEQCRGVQIHILDNQLFSPSIVQIHLLTALKKLYTEHDIFNTERISSFDKAYGTDQVRLAIVEGTSAENIISSWEMDLEYFKAMREKYLIYQKIRR